MDGRLMVAHRAKHRPLSHPVVRRRLGVVPLADGEWPAPDLPFFDDPKPIQPVSAIEQGRITDSIDRLAQHVAGLGETPLTVQQRRSLRIIADELLRRSDMEPR